MLFGLFAAQPFLGAALKQPSYQIFQNGLKGFKFLTLEVRLLV